MRAHSVKEIVSIAPCLRVNPIAPAVANCGHVDQLRSASAVERLDKTLICPVSLVIMVNADQPVKHLTACQRKMCGILHEDFANLI